MCLAVGSLITLARAIMLEERHEAVVPCGCERRGKPTGDEKGGAAGGGAPTRGASLRGDRSDSRPSAAAWLGWAAATTADTASTQPWARGAGLVRCHWSGAASSSSEYLLGGSLHTADAAISVLAASSSSSASIITDLVTAESCLRTALTMAWLVLDLQAGPACLVRLSDETDEARGRPPCFAPVCFWHDRLRCRGAAEVPLAGLPPFAGPAEGLRRRGRDLESSLAAAPACAVAAAAAAATETPPRGTHSKPKRTQREHGKPWHAYLELWHATHAMPKPVLFSQRPSSPSSSLSLPSSSSVGSHSGTCDLLFLCLRALAISAGEMPAPPAAAVLCLRAAKNLVTAEPLLLCAPEFSFFLMALGATSAATPTPLWCAVAHLA